MKYIDADRLKAEIEWRKQSLRAGICSDDAFTKEQKREMLVAREEINRFNRIIDSLQQEQPEVDLAEEIKKLEFMGSNDARDILHVAKHFYELGLKAK